MNKKRLLIFLTCFIYLISVAASAATGGLTAQITDGVNGIVKISGTTPGMQAGERVNILVLNEGATTENAASDVAKYVQYQDSAITEDGGEFTKEFRLLFAEGAQEECNLTVYVGGKGFSSEDIEPVTIYYASTGLKIDKASEYINSTDGKGDLLDENKKIFSVDTELFGALDMDELAEFFDGELEAEEVEFLENTDKNLEDNTQSYVDFERLLRYSIAMEAYNQSKKDYVISDDALEFDELLGLSAYIEENGTLSKLYAESITENGVQEIVAGLFGIDAKGKEDLQKAYAKLIVLHAIKNNKKSGSGTIGPVLTKANLKAAGIDASDYFDLDSTELADDALYQMRADLTLENLEKKIDECADIREEVKKPSVSGPSSSASGSISVGVGDSKEEKPAEPAKPATVTFTDLQGYDWAKTAIEYLAGNNVINGTGDGTFAPGGTLTREAAAKIICLALGIDVSSAAANFADVDNNSWYAPYVGALSAMGIVNGIDDSNFGVGQNITREDFAVIICRARKWAAEDKASSFADAADISSYATGAVSALSQKGIITGYTDGSFGPKNNITRAEGAQIVYKTINSK